MLVIKQRWIFRQDLVNNRNVLYLFGDNTQRTGLGGQAAEMRDEPNAFGIATKFFPYNTINSFFYDDDPKCKEIIDDDFRKLENLLYPKDQFNYPILGAEHPYAYDAIVIPMDGIGTGLSNMQATAPKLLEYINQRLEALKDF